MTDADRPPTQAAAADLPDEEAAMAEIRRALREVEFGSVVVKIHHNRIVGIEVSTKRRFSSP